jgi:hypothetical protein
MAMRQHGLSGGTNVPDWPGDANDGGKMEGRMESAVKFVLLPNGAYTSVHALAAMIADNLDNLLRVWRFSAPERDNLTLYTYAAAFRQGPGGCVCVIARLCVGKRAEQMGGGVPHRTLEEFLTQRHIDISQQTIGSDRILEERLIQPFLVDQIMEAISDHWAERYKEIFGLEANALATIEEEATAGTSHPPHSPTIAEPKQHWTFSPMVAA